MTILEFFWLEFLVLFLPCCAWAGGTIGFFLADIYNRRKHNDDTNKSS